MNHASVGLGSTTGGATTRDDVYCHLIARRAVIRAALYLGIDSMSQEALDTLSGILLEYIARIGSTLAATVESSGRSSAHCNALDALRVIELVTAPGCPTLAPIATNSTNIATGGGVATMPNAPAAAAASASGVTGMNDDVRNNSSIHNHELHQIESYTSWKDLADFCFGATFREAVSKATAVAAAAANAASISSTMNPAFADDRDQKRSSISSSGVRNGSKDAALKLNGLMMNNNNNKNEKVAGTVTLSIDNVGVVLPGSDVGIESPSSGIASGWNAPYPDEIDTFPTCPSGDHAVANPHTLPIQRFHTNESVSSLDNMPVTLSSQHDGRIALGATTTSIPHQSVLDNIRNVRTSLDSIPDNCFTTHSDEEIRKYQQDFFTLGPLVGDRRKYERTETSSAAAAAAAVAIATNEPSKKKVRIAAHNTNTANNMSDNDSDSDGGYDEAAGDDKIARRQRRPLYVPKFYPPFQLTRPRATTTFIDTSDEIDTAMNVSTNGPLGVDAIARSSEKQRKTSTIPSATTSSDSALIDSDTKRVVRSALVHMGNVSENRPWGSVQWQSKNPTSVTENIINNFDGDYITSNDDSTIRSKKDTAIADTGSLTVKAGRTGDGSSNTVTSTIVPLNRASGSRVSRILEGSMDQSAL